MTDAMTIDDVRRMAQEADDKLPEYPAFADKPASEMTDDDWDQINAAHDVRWAAGVALAEAAGFDEGLLESARPGTIDVGRQPPTATIMRQRTIAGGTIVEGAPKTSAGERTIALDPATVAALKAWRRQQSAERLLMGAGWADTGLVFTHADGGGLWPQTITAQFRTLAQGLGLPTIGVHGLRHTAASFLIASGVNPRVVQQRLGHAHVSVTLGLYTHVLPSHDRDAAAVLAAAIDGL